MQGNRKKIILHFLLMRKKISSRLRLFFMSLRMHFFRVVLSVRALGHYVTYYCID